MKALALLVSAALVIGAAPPPPSASTGTAAAPPQELPFIEVSTITITAPRARDESEIKVLKTARAAGAGVGVAGAGMMTYVLLLDLTGPFGWAASLIFLGGMTAYLSHRRLQGYQDFPPKEAAPAAPAVSTAAARGSSR
ncbi:MAG: hypothetical protein HY079_10710 [Elusimicrobia bacterium]|nr:hypothetical protein [Elusimicrobiota bacterium]